MANIKTIVVSIILVFLSACSTTMQYLAKPTNHHIEKNMARIEISRISKIVASTVTFAIRDNDVLVGKIGSGGKLIYDRPAGKTCINTDYDHQLCFLAVGGKLTKINFEASFKGGGFSLEDPSIALRSFKDVSEVLKTQEKFIPIRLKTTPSD